MNDPILDEIQRVRRELLKKHGGIDGYVEHVRQLDRARRKRHQKKSAKTKPSRAKARS